MDSRPVRLPVVSTSTRPGVYVQMAPTKAETILWLLVNVILWFGVVYLKAPVMLP